jgi:L-lysine exporter family protein LysE/ArgO
MLLLHAFFHGFILAFGLILPLGPQNSFILSKAATAPKFSSILPIIFTAGLCDSLLILLAVSGLSMVLIHLQWLEKLLFVGGAIFLFWVAYGIWRDTSELQLNPNVARLSTWALIRQTLSISLINPYAYLDTIAVIGTSAALYHGAQRLWFVGGCVLLSWLWFFCLAMVGRVAGQSALFMRVQRPVSALIISVSGVYLLLKYIELMAR